MRVTLLATYNNGPIRLANIKIPNKHAFVYRTMCTSLSAARSVFPTNESASSYHYDEHQGCHYFSTNIIITSVRKHTTSPRTSRSRSTSFKSYLLFNRRYINRVSWNFIKCTCTQKHTQLSYFIYYYFFIRFLFII